MVSGQCKSRQEKLSVQTLSLELISISKITVPESQEKNIPPERHKALFNSLTIHGSNLIPLLVRLMNNYDSEQQYGIIHAADWCQVAKKVEIKELWAWTYETTDKQVEIVRVQMEEFTQAPMLERHNFQRLLQQLEVSFDQKVDSLTQKIDLSINKKEEVIKKQVKDLQEQSIDIAQIEQFKK